jgi:hypothetical protein
MHRVQLVFCGGDCVSDGRHVLTVLIGQRLRSETKDDLVDFAGGLKRGLIAIQHRYPGARVIADVKRFVFWSTRHGS